MNFLFLEPFYGGSHREFADGLRAHSRHTIDLVTLPARFWKWRMRGAALYFIKQIHALENYDGLIATGLMSLSDLKALANGACPPAMVYFHENQLTYPLAPGEQIDYQYGFTNITTALAAERVLFNSHTHRDAFFAALPQFIKMMPDGRPNWVPADIRAKSEVLYPGCRFPDNPLPDRDGRPNPVPLIIWNHRWEFDKNPESFFQALDTVLEQGHAFRLALLGENYNTFPAVFGRARKKYGDRIVQYGYAASRKAYIRWLQQGDIVVSTARQENFGIAMVEAIRCGCIPLLPRRLCYPEIIPGAFHGQVLYEHQADLVEKLTRFLTNLPHLQRLRSDLPKAMERFGWETLIQHYDEELEALVGR